jgi:hypothetical protein
LHEKDLEKVMAYVLDQAEGNKWLDQWCRSRASTPV